MTQPEYCVYCGLPTGGTVTVAGTEAHPPSTASQDAYCCYGCRVAHTIVRERGTAGAVRWTMVRLGLAIFFTMNLMAFTMVRWSLDVYDVQPDPFQQKLFEVFRWLGLVLGLPVLLLLGMPLLQSAVEGWKHRIFSTDLLIATGVVAAYLVSAANVVRDSGTTYFEVGAMVLVMVTLGRWFEAVGKQKATEALDSLAGLLPAHVFRLADNADGQTEEQIDSAVIEVGDRLRVRAGERFATDAVVVKGSASVDEHVFTGESTPVAKAIGDEVLAGTVNLDGDVVVRVTAALRAGAFGRLLAVLQQARQTRGHYQRLTDRVASWFFPIVTLVAATAFVMHFSSGIGTAIQVSLAVLLIACPCALGLATPLAVWTALSTAVRNQVLFRSGEAIERLAAAKTVCFDKTGTLTTGEPRVMQMTLLGDAAALSVAEVGHELAQASAHPFSRAVSRYLELRWPQVARRVSSTRYETRTVPSGGVEGIASDGRLSRLGSMEFACCEFHVPAGAPAVIPIPSSTDADRFCAQCRNKLPLGLRMQMDRLRLAADQQAASVVMVSTNGVPAAAVLLAETIRTEAPAAIERLSGLGLPVHVLTGDREAKAHRLREALFSRQMQSNSEENSQTEIRCNLRPEDKVAAVEDIRRTQGTTVMVGDGINDAPALAASDAGIAMGCGADVSRDSAHICLLTNDLTRVPWAIDLARRTRSVIRQNLFWAFAYNSVGVVLAASGKLNPAIAAALMIGSSLLVISNSLRLMQNGDMANDDTQTPSNSGTEETGAGGAAESRNAIPVASNHVQDVLRSSCKTSARFSLVESAGGTR
ncbi:MAG: cation-translocating P-type ATPase [Planctomycetaceae bacterium]